MNKKQIFTLLVVTAILAVLFYFQFREYKHFPWRKLFDDTAAVFSERSRLVKVVAALVIVYAVYFLRALRWKILLSGLKQVSTSSLVPAQFVGFTGLALLGRPGELVRPYLIAKKHDVSLASQLAIWSVERVFDMGAFAVIFTISLLKLAPELHHLAGEQIAGVQHKSYSLIGVIVIAIVGIVLLQRFRSNFAAMVERRFSQEGTLYRIGKKMVAFAEGLGTIRDAKEFLQVSLISIFIWVGIGIAYLSVLHAYADPILSNVSLRAIPLVMAGSMLGSIFAVPGVGGGPQLGTLAVMNQALGVDISAATSCSLVLWLATFASVIPVGLFLAHRERLSLRKLETEAEAQVEA
jgi:uncharacterized protein (TIRG00374 family)